jgi:hypothetical protein
VADVGTSYDDTAADRERSVSHSLAGSRGRGKGKTGGHRRRIEPIEGGSVGGSGEWCGGYVGYTFEEAFMMYQDPPVVKAAKGAARAEEVVEMVLRGEKEEVGARGDEEREWARAAVAGALNGVKEGLEGVEGQLDELVREKRGCDFRNPCMCV